MFPFTIRQLELFSSLCRTGSFRDTADEFRISQPSISNQISALEFQLGLKLFIRERGRPPLLTAEGVEFAREGEAFLEMGRQLARRRMVRVAQEPTRLKVYIGPVLFNERVKHRLAAFYADNPDLDLEFVHDRARPQMVQELRRGRFDLAIFYHWEKLEMAGVNGGAKVGHSAA